MGISDSLILAVGGAIEKAFWEDTQVCRAIEYGRPFTDETRNALARAAIAAARPMIEAEAFEKAAKVAEEWPEFTDTPFVIPGRSPMDEDDIGWPEQRGSTRSFAKPKEIAAAIRSLIEPRS